MYYVIDDYEGEGFTFSSKIEFRRWLLNEYDEDRHLIHTTEQEHLEHLAKYYVDKAKQWKVSDSPTHAIRVLEMHQ